ncbi:hypothetical protein GCM10025868_27050 [Angustibacter aerolatus]|uniref:Uncharacterized protein n=1 Tax=Angustibacter aerolatus TaxID=1162965 RepID=A0ABQ6JJP8_9ACTN|nr:hypothetical protein GCM10025868_27050 [Angustibacter aerolatus]
MLPTFTFTDSTVPLVPAVTSVVVALATLPVPLTVAVTVPVVTVAVRTDVVVVSGVSLKAA